MRQKGGKSAGIIIALIVAVTLSMFYLSNTKFFNVLEEKTLDMRFAMRGKILPGPETVIAAIDEKSIKKLGRFPWPRSVWGRVVDRLTEDGARVIVFDVFFTEPEKVESDDMLQQAIRRSGRVILPVVFDFSKTGFKETGFTDKKLDFMTPSSYTVVKHADEPFSPLKAAMVLPTLYQFSSVAKSLAHINMIPDDDGELRWEMLAIDYQGDYYAPIGLQAVRLYRGLKTRTSQSITLERSTLETNPFRPMSTEECLSITVARPGRSRHIPLPIFSTGLCLQTRSRTKSF